jgi:hypothetical protein
MSQTLMFIGTLIIVCIFLSIVSMPHVEHFENSKSVDKPSLTNTINTVDNDIQTELNRYQCPEMMAKGSVTIETSVSDAEKIGRCTGILDFKNRLLQKIKDIVGTKPAKES